MPAVTSLVAGFFVDDVGDLVEREYYPAEQPGVALPLSVATIEGIKIALLTILVYLVALPFVLLAGAGFLIFFIATAWLQGKQYFELAAMRFRPPAEAKAMRKDHAATVFTAGLFIAAFVSIPIVNLATPLFGMAFMVHMHKRLSGSRPELIEPATAEERAYGLIVCDVAREWRDQQEPIDGKARQHRPGFVDAERQRGLFDQRTDDRRSRRPSAGAARAPATVLDRARSRWRR